MSDADVELQICHRCGTKTSELTSIEAGMRLAAQAADKEGIGTLPNEVCLNCYNELLQFVSKGAQLRFEQKARDKNRQILWKSRVNLVKRARACMMDKNYTEAAVAYEKYLRVVEMAYDKPKGGLEPDLFGSTVRSKEITVIAMVYWDLFRIYDSHPSYRDKMATVGQKLKVFLPLSRIMGDVSKKATSFAAKAKNQDIARRFLKDIKAAQPKCFIATAAFEVPMADEVQFLRQYRDEKLAKHRLGRAFIASYYFLSPPIARFISRSETLKKAVRKILRLLIQRIR